MCRCVWMWVHGDRHLWGGCGVCTHSRPRRYLPIGLFLGISWGVCACCVGRDSVCPVAWGLERPITWTLMKMISMAGKMSSSCDLQWMWLMS